MQNHINVPLLQLHLILMIYLGLFAGFVNGESNLRFDSHRDLYQNMNGSQPTPSPTSHTQTWAIGSPDFEVISDNVFNGKLQVKHDIGFSVDPNKVTVELLDKNCFSTKDDTGLEVSLEPNMFSSSPFIYNITINQALIGSSPGGFVTHTDVASTGTSRGHIEFCTRVSTYERSIMVSARRTGFKLNFDLTDNGFSIFGLNLLQNNADAFATLVDDSFGVDICQCDGNYNCYDTNSAPRIKQDENLLLCLYPTANGDESVVHISNFLLRIVSSDGSYGYSPVSFGFNTWKEDALTDVSTQDGTDTIKISTPIVAQFYIEGFDELKVNGEAFLEFDSTKNQEHPAFSSFETQISLEGRSRTGCLTQIFRRVRSSFF